MGLGVRRMLISPAKVTGPMRPTGSYTMVKYKCDVCDYVYDPEQGDPENGVAAGTAFEDLPEDWMCPVCGVGKDEFSPQ